MPKGPPGNKSAVKLGSPELRQLAFKQYCDHIASGMPKEAFSFDHPDITLTSETVESYIEKYPNEFPAILMKHAMAKRYEFWMKEGMSLMRGKYKGGSPVVWQTCMRNIFKGIGWDREQIQQDNKTHVERIAGAIRTEAVNETEDCDQGIDQEN